MFYSPIFFSYIFTPLLYINFLLFYLKEEYKDMYEIFFFIHRNERHVHKIYKYLKYNKCTTLERFHYQINYTNEFDITFNSKSQNIMFTIP